MPETGTGCLSEAYDRRDLMRHALGVDYAQRVSPYRALLALVMHRDSVGPYDAAAWVLRRLRAEHPDAAMVADLLLCATVEVIEHGAPDECLPDEPDPEPEPEQEQEQEQEQVTAEKLLHAWAEIFRGGSPRSWGREASAVLARTESYLRLQEVRKEACGENDIKGTASSRLSVCGG